MNLRRLLPITLAVVAATPAVLLAAPSSGEAGRLTGEEIAAGVLAAMDRTADPCRDFYRYACGGWLDTTKLPADRSRWTRSFSVIDEENRAVVREILEEAAAAPGDDRGRQRVGHYYGSCMAEEAVEKAGATPLEPVVRGIAAIADAASLLETTGRLHRLGVGALFETAVFPDFKNPDRDIAFFVQGGLGMPDRDYYVSEDPAKRELLAQYEGHVARMLGLLGEDGATAARHAAEILAFETELARASRPAAEMRVVERLYNKLDIGGLKELTPGLPWDAYLTGTGYPGVVDINVATPEFFQALERLVRETDLEAVRTYLRWQAVNSAAALLSSDFVNADFEFFGAKLAGQKEIEPRWKRCGRAAEEALGEAVGSVYVERRFGGRSKEVALEMIGDIETAFAASLPGLAWMDEATRARALDKKAAVHNKIGYPDEWRDYSAMRLAPGSYFANALAAREFEFDRQARKIGKPVDRGEWFMAPQRVNAYYNPLFNEIVFPAGILQPPFFHQDFPAAMNYGGIGGVIGHELTHGFDDQGRKFDPKGNLSEWWAPEATERFEAQAKCVDDFYAAYEVEPGLNVNGKLTLGENIADVGGLKQGYDAYKLWEARHGEREPFIEGLTNEQLLFVAWGQVWCTVAAPEALRLQVTTDPHSPSQFRVNGPISNNPAFVEAFGCAPGTPMRPANQCVVW